MLYLIINSKIFATNDVKLFGQEQFPFCVTNPISIHQVIIKLMIKVLLLLLLLLCVYNWSKKDRVL